MRFKFVHRTWDSYKGICFGFFRTNYPKYTFNVHLWKHEFLLGIF